MQRSRINAAIGEAIALARQHGVPMPRFATWSAEEAAQKDYHFDELRACRLGWDVTDFGTDNFDETGLVTLTVRAGNPRHPAYAGRVYAEKLLFLRPNQSVPMHHHDQRSEDIICCVGGTFYVAAYTRGDNGSIVETETTISLDGERRLVAPGDAVNLLPGDSISISPGLLHEFYTREEPAILRAISGISDDGEDMLFLEKHDRFPVIIEDVGPTYSMSRND